VETFFVNSGQAKALYHGFTIASAPWIMMLDGDGQNPPDELARLWSLRSKADMIAGARAVRHDSVLRRCMSRTANAVRGKLLRDGITDSGCSLKLFRREVVISFEPIPTMYSFLPAFAKAAGFSVLEIPVSHRPRQKGKSKYGLGVMAIRPCIAMLILAWKFRKLRTAH
jgi:dolichol-phosphate mannosyltransferase